MPRPALRRTSVACFVALMLLVLSHPVAAQTNLALGKPATASTVQTGNGAANANDGSLTARWAASSAAYPQWWRVDLGAGASLTNVSINWYSTTTRAYKYKIEVSSDAATFTTVVDKTANTTFADTSDNVTATARYVRVTITGCTTTTAYASAY